MSLKCGKIFQRFKTLKKSTALLFEIHEVKKKKCVIYAPANGKVVDLSKVPDPVFSKKMMGEGVGLIFEGDTLFAPLDGKVKLVASTKHAIGFEANNKAEILMHIGLELLIKEGDRVKHGTPVLKINRQFMKERNIDLTTPIVVTNSEYKVFKSNITDVTTDSVIMECTKN